MSVLRVVHSQKGDTLPELHIADRVARSDGVRLAGLRRLSSLCDDGYDTRVTSLQSLFDLTGKVALVTGGSRGLGLEMARALGEAGAKVAITARRAQWLEPAEQELRAAGIECLAATCDV